MRMKSRLQGSFLVSSGTTPAFTSICSQSRLDSWTYELEKYTPVMLSSFDLVPDSEDGGRVLYLSSPLYFWWFIIMMLFEHKKVVERWQKWPERLPHDHEVSRFHACSWSCGPISCLRVTCGDHPLLQRVGCTGALLSVALLERPWCRDCSSAANYLILQSPHWQWLPTSTVFEMIFNYRSECGNKEMLQ